MYIWHQHVVTWHVIMLLSLIAEEELQPDHRTQGLDLELLSLGVLLYPTSSLTPKAAGSPEVSCISPSPRITHTNDSNSL